jgi:hyperosmotically inducible periplasmic protein
MDFRQAAMRPSILLGLLLVVPSLGFTQGGPPNPRADNTAVNVRDKKDELPQATDQTNNKEDLALAAKVRRAIVSDRSLSLSAHNIKLVVVSGVATLRGPVATAGERTRVGDIASGVDGVAHVDNQLDVTNH